MLALRDHISVLNVALVYLPFIALASAEWGFGPGLLASVTVNLLLGIRATALKYQPPRERVVDLLSVGRPIRTQDVAILGERMAA